MTTHHDGKNVYTFWQKHHKDEQTEDMLLPTLYPAPEGVAVSVENPQPGLWKISTGGGWYDGKKRPKKFALMQIWVCRKGDETRKPVTLWEDGLELVGDIDGQPVTADQIAWRWPGSIFLTKKEKTFYFENDMRFEEEAPPATDNSNDLTTFEGMCAELRGEIFEAVKFITETKIDALPLANRCENHRKRLASLGKQAIELKKAEKRPLQEAVDAVEKKWMDVINEASAAAVRLRDLVDAFDNAEKARIKKETEDKARKDFEERQEKARKEREEQEAQAKAAREENERRLAEHNAKMGEDPIAAMTTPVDFVPEPEVTAVVEEKFVAPIVDVPKILYGTGTEGSRRSTKEAPPTAIITDLKAAAVYYAEQQDPELIKLIQKLADRAAKARATVPGITMQKAAA